ncbi:MAG: ribosomal subunit interface protein [Porticoccaceae bacterium]|nr:MAG: ribosomal subunit interface protein [Porticoccaceae bacterium]
MQLNITGHHLEITDAIRDYVTSKLSRLEKHFDRITSTHVILSVDNKLTQKAEAKIHVSGGELFADATHEDLYAAIDSLVDKLDRQLIKYKEKLRGH